jgi:hypothetical protein
MGFGVYGVWGFWGFGFGVYGVWGLLDVGLVLVVLGFWLWCLVINLS